MLLKMCHWTPFNIITDNKISCVVESNILAGTESFPIPAVLKHAAYMNQPFNRIKLLWPEVILLSGVYCTNKLNILR